jgi:hypothetical protein
MRWTIGLGAILLLPLLLSGCAGVAHAEPSKDPSYREGRLGAPILLDTSDYAMIPFVAKAGYWDLSSAKPMPGNNDLTTYYGTHVNWNNLVLVHKETGANHLLLDRKAYITRFYTPNPDPREREQGPWPKFLLVGISDTDTNGDGWINDNDAVVAFVADMAGRGLTQVTPTNSQIENFTIDRGREALYLTVRIDSDGNRRFDDDSVLLRVDLKKPGQGVRVISDETLRQALEVMRR